MSERNFTPSSYAPKSLAEAMAGTAVEGQMVALVTWAEVVVNDQVTGASHRVAGQVPRAADRRRVGGGERQRGTRRQRGGVGGRVVGDGRGDRVVGGVLEHEADRARLHRLAERRRHGRGGATPPLAPEAGDVAVTVGAVVSGPYCAA